MKKCVSPFAKAKRHFIQNIFVSFCCCFFANIFRKKLFARKVKMYFEIEDLVFFIKNNFLGREKYLQDGANISM
jgi:hypothetical protein